MPGSAKKEIDALLTAIAVQHQHKTPEFAVFLGAGASVSSGIPAATALALEALRFHGKFTTPPLLPTATDAEVEEWARKQRKFNDSDSFYSNALRMLGASGTVESFIKPYMTRGRPSRGYRALARLLRARVFQTVLTTNFDRLVEIATVPLSSQEFFLNVLSTDHQLREVAGSPSEPTLLRLHGDFNHHDLANLTEETDQTPEIRYEAVRKICSRGGMIVVGYGGSDENIMSNVFEAAMSEKSFGTQGVYWCVRKGSRPPERYLNLARKNPDRLFWLEIESFDWLFVLLENHFAPRGNEPNPEDLRALFNDQALMNRVLVSGLEAVASSVSGDSGEKSFQDLVKNLEATYGFLTPLATTTPTALRFGISDVISTQEIHTAMAGRFEGRSVEDDLQKTISAGGDTPHSVLVIPIRIQQTVIGVAVLGLGAETTGEIRHSTIEATLLGIFATVWPQAVTGRIGTSTGQG